MGVRSLLVVWWHRFRPPRTWQLIAEPQKDSQQRVDTSGKHVFDSSGGMEQMAVEYEDRWIRCTAEAIAIRGYYFPWGTKHIPYRSIRSIQRVSLGALTGRARLWGTANPGRWASFDPGRASKTVGFDLHLAGPVRPLITPDDPNAFETAVRGHVDPGVFAAGGGRSSIV
jgi:hypothetical protein